MAGTCVVIKDPGDEIDKGVGDDYHHSLWNDRIEVEVGGMCARIEAAR